MIIVTGMDNSGKTTLVQQLLGELNRNPFEKRKFQVVNSPGPVAKEIQENWVVNQVTLEQEERFTNIYERFPLLEEVVYGEVLRGNPLFTYGDSYFKLLKKANPLIVYTRPSRERIFNFGDRPQMDGVIEKSTELLAAYDDLIFKMMSEGWKVVVYDFDSGSPEDLAEAYLFTEILDKFKGGIF